MLGIFVYMFICEVTTTKLDFHFYKHCNQTATRLICQRVIFAQNASIVFSFNIPLYIEKNPLNKLCKVLEMELKTTPSTKSSFRENQI